MNWCCVSHHPATNFVVVFTLYTHIHFRWSKQLWTMKPGWNMTLSVSASAVRMGAGWHHGSHKQGEAYCKCRPLSQVTLQALNLWTASQWPQRQREAVMSLLWAGGQHEGWCWDNHWYLLKAFRSSVSVCLTLVCDVWIFFFWHPPAVFCVNLSVHVLQNVVLSCAKAWPWIWICIGSVFWHVIAANADMQMIG